MLQPQKRNSNTDNEPEPISSTLQMALTLRLKIFTAEEIEPAATAFLTEFSDRLDQVRARRHAVDFEAAKAWAWWKGQRTTELVERGQEALARDPEIQRLRDLEGVETIVFDHYAGTALRALIGDRFDDIELKIQSLRNNRLNVQ